MTVIEVQHRDGSFHKVHGLCFRKRKNAKACLERLTKYRTELNFRLAKVRRGRP